VIVKRVVCLLAVAALVAGACSSSSSSPLAHPAGLKLGGTLTVAVSNDFTYADPALVSDASSMYVANQVVEGLVGLQAGSMSTVVPVLAAALPTVGDAGLTYTFKLRSGVKFQDGTPFDAAAVKANFERWNSFPKGDLEDAAVYFGTVFGGFGDASNLASVAAPDGGTVVLTLRHPQSNLLIALANPAFGIQSPDAIAANDGNDTSLAKNAYALGQGGEGKAMVGTGPFILSEWVPGDHVKLVRNPDYWGSTTEPYLDAVVFRLFADGASELQALQSGAVDMIQSVDPVSLAQITGSAHLRVLARGQSCEVTQLAMNDADTVNGAANLLADKNVRLAIASALNRPAYVAAIYSGAAAVADNWVPEGSLYYKPENLPGYDITRSKGYLTQAGLASAKPTVDLWFPTGGSPAPVPDPKSLATSVANDLQVIGFTVNLKSEAMDKFLADAAAGSFGMWISTTPCMWASADYFLDTAFFHYVNDAPGPEFGYANDDLNATMAAALQATDGGTVKAGWEKAQDLVAADMPTVPLLNARPPAASRDYVMGFVAAGSEVEVLSTVWLDK
jgi:peptide/nickel transport system substrate-binding protein